MRAVAQNDDVADIDLLHGDKLFHAGIDESGDFGQEELGVFLQILLAGDFEAGVVLRKKFVHGTGYADDQVLLVAGILDVDPDHDGRAAHERDALQRPGVVPELRGNLRHDLHAEHVKLLLLDRLQNGLGADKLARNTLFECDLLLQAAVEAEAVHQVRDYDEDQLGFGGGLLANFIQPVCAVSVL